ncbi:MAG: O-antigen ligase family protein [Cyanobacteria bacterium]|nr:O-antigen ligase family protein [Cyanobacteriota bacterium]MDA1020221.1 O-antigen ligase family protein [Cyanobacteriota bacterium]
MLAGLALFAIALLQDPKRIKLIQSNFGNELQVLNKLFIIYICINSILAYIHDLSVFVWIKTLLGTYAQWFWALALLAGLKFDVQNKIKLTVIGVSSFSSVVIVLQLIGLVPMVGDYFGILSQAFTSSGMILVGLFMTLSSLRGAGTVTKQSNAPGWIATLLTAAGNNLLLKISLFMQLIALFALGQRSVWTGLILSLLFYLIMTKQYLKKSFWLVLILLVLTGSLVISSSERVGRKVERFVNPYYWTQANSIKVRQKLWEINKQAWQAKPLTGINEIIEYEELRHAHNIYFQQLYTGGWLRFIAWLSFYLVAGFFLLRQARQAPEFFAIFIALSIEGVLENWWGDGEVLSLFLLALILALGQSKYKE